MHFKSKNKTVLAKTAFLTKTEQELPTHLKAENGNMQLS